MFILSRFFFKVSRPSFVIINVARFGECKSPAFFKYDLAHPTLLSKIAWLPLVKSSFLSTSVT